MTMSRDIPATHDKLVSPCSALWAHLPDLPGGLPDI
jgi:hypothetical protein